MTRAELLRLKAEALREFAERHTDESRVLTVDLDRRRLVRVRDLALDDADQLEAEAYRIEAAAQPCACGSDAVSMTPTEVVVHDPAGCRIVPVAP